MDVKLRNSQIYEMYDLTIGEYIPHLVKKLYDTNENVIFMSFETGEKIRLPKSLINKGFFIFK